VQSPEFKPQSHKKKKKKKKKRQIWKYSLRVNYYPFYFPFIWNSEVMCGHFREDFYMKKFIRKINNFKFYNIFYFKILLDKVDVPMV
jgi:hypothetical protein